ncbi:MAG: lipopolysaccharide transport periplasmic protein LptA [Smithellaceae bacterium]|nr:lipopolysaccharide transport periplasmic protein LptA [Smithellaceae bacterium]
MKNGLVIVLVSFLLLIPIHHAGAQSVEGKKDSKVEKEKQKPIKIEADKLDAHNEKRMVIFTGNVIATQEDTVIKADRMTLYYKKDAQVGASAAKDPLKGGDLDRIEAKGRVIIHMEERIATGDDAVFTQDTQQIVLIGNATLREGMNVVKGERVTYFMAENRGVVEGGEKGRVSATIYTREMREKKK